MTDTRAQTETEEQDVDEDGNQPPSPRVTRPVVHWFRGGTFARRL
jgi:hypothetical protein